MLLPGRIAPRQPAGAVDADLRKRDPPAERVAARAEQEVDETHAGRRLAELDPRIARRQFDELGLGTEFLGGRVEDAAELPLCFGFDQGAPETRPVRAAQAEVVHQLDEVLDEVVLGQPGLAQQLGEVLPEEVARLTVPREGLLSKGGFNRSFAQNMANG